MGLQRNRKTPNWGTSRVTGIWVLILFVFICQLLAYTWCRVQNVRRGYEITEAQAEYRRLTAAQKGLKIELARLKSPDRIARIATGRLGLVMPSTRQVIDIE